MDLSGLISDGAALAEMMPAATTRAQWCPHNPTPKQSEFLSLECDEALFGGAAGGGKSDALLMDALQDVDRPGYSALILRRTFPQLSQPDGIMDRAHQWLAPTAAEWRASDSEYRFPSGAKLKFGHLSREMDKLNYQGGAYQMIGFDELTQFAESQYLYLHSRLRRLAGQDVQIRMRSATNPGGPGHRWVKARFVDPDTAEAVFVPSKLADNPHLDQDAYREALSKLDETTRRQLEDGEWVDDERGLIYPIQARDIVSTLPDEDMTRVLAIDLGASVTAETTAIVELGFTATIPNKTWVLRAERHSGLIPSDLATRIREMEPAGGYEMVVMDEGALGAGYGGELRKRWTIPVQPAQKRSKLGFRKLLRGALERGEVLIYEPMCGVLIEEASELLWDARGLDADPLYPDHLTDALLYGWRESRAYQAERPPDRPKPGTAEWRAAEQKRMLDDDLKRYSKRGKAWWQR